MRAKAPLCALWMKINELVPLDAKYHIGDKWTFSLEKSEKEAEEEPNKVEARWQKGMCGK